MRSTRFLFILLILSVAIQVASVSLRASVDSVPGEPATLSIGEPLAGGFFPPLEPSGLWMSEGGWATQPQSISPLEAFRRMQSVLEHFLVPIEKDSQPLFKELTDRQTLSGLKGLLPILDPTGSFQHFSASETGESFHAFQDADSRTVPDFTVRLASGSAVAPSDPASFHQRLLKARANPSDFALAGLRIALDPGHMGGEEWDNRTGKAVHDGHGHKLSEGMMALQVSLLLEERFKALGAEVMITHRGLGPVTPLPYHTMDLKPFALNEIRENTLSAWFRGLLSSGAAGSPALFSAFDASPAIQGIFAQNEVNRDKYFILREDLDARARAINAFDADIALVIHFDTSSPANDPWGVNPGHLDGTKVYVVGSYEPAELSSREARALFGRHLLDQFSWDASLQLGRSVVSHLHTDLGINYDTYGGGSSHQVESGVFARNLGVSRKVTDRALTYVECLYYNDPTEFASLWDAHHPLQVDGANHPYSDRLLQVAEALKSGVLGFVANYQ